MEGQRAGIRGATQGSNRVTSVKYMLRLLDTPTREYL